MTQKQLIALANTIREYNAQCLPGLKIPNSAIHALAGFCAEQNPLFKRDRWLDYIAGKCGPNGGRATK